MQAAVLHAENDLRYEEVDRPDPGPGQVLLNVRTCGICGTDSHIVWLDLTPKNITGDKAEKILEEVGIACNKNAIPYDPNPPKITSGLRFGTAAATSRGFDENDFREIGDLISEILDNINQNQDNHKEFISSMKSKVIGMCKKYPIYNEAF